MIALLLIVLCLSIVIVALVGLWVSTTGDDDEYL